MNNESSNNNLLNFNVSFGRRLLLFLCATVLCFVIGNVIVGLIVKLRGMTPAVLRISAVLQDVIVFIAPALITAVLVTRLPARLLAIDRKPRLSVCVWSCLVLAVSIPAMNALVQWNESITLPQSLATLEQAMRQAEESARESIGILLGGDSIASLIVSILIVGVLAGLSEELFFRGALQRLLSTAGYNKHLCIWLVALIFSITHLQFYGFFGRLLLGAYFGYLLVWTRCLWVPIIVHVFNNTLYIIGTYFERTEGAVADINRLGTDSVFQVMASIVLTVIGLMTVYRLTAKNP